MAESLVVNPPQRSEHADGAMVSVVMPCLNEERTVGACVKQALRALHDSGIRGDVVVCDNGSSDASVVEAEKAGARVVHCSQRGYGNAIRFAAERCRGDYIVMGDTDGSYDFGAVAAFVAPLEAGADLVIGNRFRGGIQRGAMPWKNRYIGNPLLTGVLNLLFHTGIGDAHCGLRAFTRQAFQRMRLESAGMEFASEMVVKAAKCKMRIVEVPTTLAPDGRDRPPHLLPWRDGWRHLKFLIMFSPLHLFLVPGVSLVVLGVLLLLMPAGGAFQTAGLRLDIHWMVLGVLLLVVGVQVMQFGVVARLYTVIHRFPERDFVLEWLRERFRFEHGLLLGAAMVVLGLSIDGWVLWRWVETGFGALEKVRPALVATAVTAVGVQTLFFTALVSIVGTSGGGRSDVAAGSATSPPATQSSGADNSESSKR